MNNKDRMFTLSPALFWLLLFCQSINFLLLVDQLSLWMLALIALCLLWRVAILVDYLVQPSKWLILPFALAGCLVLVISSKQLGLLITMVHLLCFSYALKQLELNKRKDFYQLFLLGIFVLAAAMIFKQSLYFASVLALVLILNVAVLFFAFIQANSPVTAFKGTVKLLLQSVPLAVILFIVFPRLAPFWQVPIANSAKTGLSDRVALGDITQLIQSNELAFRVKFSTPAPIFNQLYWRTLVLENYDGKQWTKSAQSINNAKDYVAGKYLFSPQLLGQSTSYQVIAQPSYQAWLFALAVAELTSSTVIKLPDHTLLNSTPITQAISYQVTSFLQAPLNKELAPAIRLRNLAIPLLRAPRLVAEAQRLRSITATDNELIAKVLQHIRQQNYRYTLKPPVLTDNSLDQFYFDTKAGFCVHYASSFTFLMRAAGIPARLVTGYMGGEYNANGAYYSIYQYDAHAWSEVWLKDQGWVRIDPTAAVSPDRVEKGFSQVLFKEQSALTGNIFSWQNYRHIVWLNVIRQQLNALDYQWTRWVIGYTPEKQFKLLQHWFGRFSALKLAMLVAFSMIIILFALWLTNRTKKIKVNRQPWQTMYQQALDKLAKHGFVKEPQKSVDEFSQLIRVKLPDVDDSFSKLSRCFIRLNYCLLIESEQQKILQQMKQQFSLFKRSLFKYTFKRR